MASGHNLRQLLILCGSVATALGAIQACSSTPEHVRIGPTKYTPPVDIEWEKQGEPTNLPPGWTPGGEITLPVRIRGITYNPRLCIAINPANPDCVYINLASCDSAGGWVLYCKSLLAHDRSGPANGTLRHCPSEWGTVEYGETSGFTYVSFTMTCGQEELPPHLAGGVTLTAPGLVAMSPDDFDLVFGGVIPDGTLVELTGDLKEVAWNYYQLSRETLSFQATSGQWIDAAVRTIPGGPPIAFVAVNGAIIQTDVVYKPY
jgi:hypothetical protein